MKQRCVEVIIENGNLEYISEKLPAGRIKAQLIFSTTAEEHIAGQAEAILAETWGIYRWIDPEQEVLKLRSEWDRDLPHELPR